MTSSQRQKKRQAIFDQAVKAYQSVTSRSERRCFCPICERPFTQQDLEARILTLEHVPPKALGGKELVLTCSGCNNAAGTKVDSQAAQRKEFRAFVRAVAAGESAYEGRVRLRFGSVELNCSLSVEPNTGGLHVGISGEHNDPEVLHRGKEELDGAAKQGTWDGMKLSVTTRSGYHPRRARVSDLRAGYLLAFAKLGYSYAFHPRLAAVREQLRDPGTETIKGFWAAPTGDQVMVLARKPIEALLVVMPQAAVLLPSPFSKVDPYRRMVEICKSGLKVSIQGQSMPWPLRPEMVLDFRRVRE